LGHAEVLQLLQQAAGQPDVLGSCGDVRMDCLRGSVDGGQLPLLLAETELKSGPQWLSKALQEVEALQQVWCGLLHALHQSPDCTRCTVLCCCACTQHLASAPSSTAASPTSPFSPLQSPSSPIQQLVAACLQSKAAALSKLHAMQLRISRHKQLATHVQLSAAAAEADVQNKGAAQLQQVQVWHQQQLDSLARQRAGRDAAIDQQVSAKRTATERRWREQEQAVLASHKRAVTSLRAEISAAGEAHKKSVGQLQAELYQKELQVRAVDPQGPDLHLSSPSNRANRALAHHGRDELTSFHITPALYCQPRSHPASSCLTPVSPAYHFLLLVGCIRCYLGRGWVTTKPTAAEHMYSVAGQEEREQKKKAVNRASIL
jgi:hypothetical protein